MSMIEGDRISQGNSGASVEEVITSLEKLTGQTQGEFESTSDFNARRAALLAGRSMGGISVSDTIAFTLPVGSSREPFGYRFDADTSQVRLFVLPVASRLNGIGGPAGASPNGYPSLGANLDRFDLSDRLDSASSYLGSNAYGATVTVEKTRRVRVGIAANQIPFLLFKREPFYSSPMPIAQFTMNNAEAAKEMPLLRVMIVMRLAAPYIVYHYEHFEPTRDAPYEISRQSRYLTGDVLGIVFYSGVTGEIFSRTPVRLSDWIGAGQQASIQPIAPAAPRIGHVIMDCAGCPEMVVIPAGSFDMGETGAAHRVTLKSFAIGKTEVTQGQWKAVMGDNPSRFNGCGDNCPVEQVSWDDTQQYIHRLNAKTGKSYGLPSEAQWEYACRAGANQTYCGSDAVDSVAIYGRATGDRTLPVGGKQANAWGLYDMSGNVWEWVQDCWNDNYDDAPADGSALTTGECSQRVLRGGSWGNNPQVSRATSRGKGRAAYRDGFQGFRLARILP
jgi:formylglycine-generating enzyme required for sulfatase activity